MAMQNDDLTWDDVIAVAKMMGTRVEWETDFNDFTVYRYGTSFGATFSNPTDALEYLSAEEHPIEKMYANILRTKP